MQNGRERRPFSKAGRFRLDGHQLSAVVGLIVVFGWNYIPIGRSHSLTSAHDDLLTIVAEWMVVIVLGVIAFALQKRKGADFGLQRFGWGELFGMLVALIAAYVIVGFVSRFVTMPAWSTSPREMLQLASLPFLLKLGLVLTAAFCEEFMYRGFAIEELAGLTGSAWLAGLISWLGFSFAHAGLYGLSTALAIPATLGALLTILYLWRRNLPVCMLMHGILDGVSILVLPTLLAHHMK